MSSFALNRVMIAGNLTRTPETKAVGADKTVCKFSLAINRRLKSGDGEMKEETTFVDVEAWGRTAELVAQYCDKGKPVYVEGRLKLDSWTDKEGQKRSKLAVVADSVQFLPDGRGGQATGGGGQARPAPAPGDDEPAF